ncbi:ScbR family autoregulator-binding transcription factor [Streptomyces sp. NPDC090442]|uniref:ScbR family autoregulator-binding transcription factor n=1 Tax=Streptomyces sp. NPDC090442 TaxID=3365962 RepID=UPI003824CE9C
MPRQRQDRALRTRAAIVRAAAEVFAEQGYAGASVTKITDRAGLTMGAMYFHFKNKAALAREIVVGQPDRVLPARPSAGLQRVVDITLTWAHQLLEDPVLLAGARLVMEQEEFIGSEQNSHQQWAGIFERELGRARERGELLPGCDTAATARLIVNACTGAQMHAQMASGHRDLPDRVVEMWRCLLPALAAPEAAAAIELDVERGKVAGIAS